MAPVPGEIPFALAKLHLSDALAVGDGALIEAVAYAARSLKLLVEPSGAAGLAALISGEYPSRGMAVAWCSAAPMARSARSRGVAGSQ